MSEMQQRLLQYRGNAMINVLGWLGPKAVDVLELAASYQDSNSIRGDALEIGVYQGSFFLALMASINDDEVAVAADIFDEQNLNIDFSGSGSDTFKTFKENIERFANRPTALRTLVGDSMVMRASDTLAHSPHNGFRLISVDGGHTAEHVMNDLGLAAQIIVSGGAIFLDDIHSPHWPGVYEGYVRFMMHANRSLAPVIYADNKLVLTTIGHAPNMVEYMRHNFQPSEGKYMAEVSSFGFKYIASS